MNKRFCDMCGKPAANIKKLETFHRHDPDGRNADGEPAPTLIMTSVHFSFRNHRTGFGGPPDLCRRCITGLCKEIVALARTLPTEN